MIDYPPGALCSGSVWSGCPVAGPRRTSLDDAPAPDSPYAVDAFGAEQIAVTIWAAVHGLAVLEQTHLRDFDADFSALNRQGLQRLLAGLTPSATRACGSPP